MHSCQDCEALQRLRIVHGDAVVLTNEEGLTRHVVGKGIDLRFVLDFLLNFPSPCVVKDDFVQVVVGRKKLAGAISCRAENSLENFLLRLFGLQSLFLANIPNAQTFVAAYRNKLVFIEGVVGHTIHGGGMALEVSQEIQLPLEIQELDLAVFA